MSTFSERLRAEEEGLLACVHCGLCLPSCPTYAVLGDENDSPRGRIYLMRAVAEERLEPTPAYVKHLDRCILCRACETACPSGVPFGSLMEAARADLHDDARSSEASQGGLQSYVLNLAMKRILPSPIMVKLALWPAKLLARFGVGMKKRGEGFWARYPRLHFMLAMMPSPDPKTVARPSPEFINSTTQRVVAQFTGCVMPEAFGEVNDATTRVLKVNGCAVDMPPKQGCCGALHSHSGRREEALELARQNINAFDDGTNAPIVVNAAGCGASLREYDKLLAHDPDYAEKAKQFSERIRDISEYLMELRPVVGGPVRQSVTYDAPCHLHHAQKVQNAPIDLLNTIPELELIPLPHADQCCGAGGIYNLVQHDLSMEVLEVKMDNIRATGADVVTTGNPGCHMQILAGARQDGMELSVRHPVELLDQSYDAAGLYTNTENG